MAVTTMSEAAAINDNPIQQSNIANQPVVPVASDSNATIDYNPSTSTAENLNQLTQEGGSYLSIAKQQGESAARRRGLGNTTLAGQAAMGSAIQAAAPIAESDAAKEQAKWTLGATVSSNLQGQYASSLDDILNQYAISVNQIETAQNIPTAEKDKMIQNSIARRDADMNFLKNMYTAMPGFNTDWGLFPSA